ncbi:PREDICTED: Protein of unknown function DUF3511 [Prunus dulcis]|uniref:Uncharacterized protein n=1 Tax=Prunus dulcis TaxID=3755 RepID=A0A5E4GIM4_PRUDU|nr:PREDICTED: Protein of unknown function DUF3511 [Prunus dulcis]
MEKSKSFPEYTSAYSGEFGFRERSNSYNFNGPTQKGSGFATSSDPELQRKKRVASYNVFTMEGQGETRAITIHVKSGSPCKRLVVPPIAMATTIHMRYEEMNLYRVLVVEVKNMTNKPKLEQGLVLLEGQPRFVEPTNSPGSICPLEVRFGPQPPCPGQLELL